MIGRYFFYALTKDDLDELGRKLLPENDFIFMYRAVLKNDSFRCRGLSCIYDRLHHSIEKLIVPRSFEKKIVIREHTVDGIAVVNAQETPCIEFRFQKENDNGVMFGTFYYQAINDYISETENKEFVKLCEKITKAMKRSLEYRAKIYFGREASALTVDEKVLW